MRKPTNAPPAFNDEPFIFGPYRLDPQRHLLLKDDKPLRIGERALDILTALVNRAGELVTKEELIARAWPHTVVEESNLRAQVAALRRVLGDERMHTPYIVAVSGRGYRFVAPVLSGSHEPAVKSNFQDRGHNLPIRLTRLIGRDEDVWTVRGRFERFRLVTIVGPGGIGKTSVGLAVAGQLARDYADGLFLVDLAPLSDPELLPRALASALGLEQVSDRPLADVTAYLHDRDTLLVFDSCERLIDQVAFMIESLLKQAPDLHVLATSREALRAEGESVYRLAPLHVPPVVAGLSAAQALAYPAVELFVERASANGDGFAVTETDAPVVADICRQLDGIPLAIELAASRVDAFGLRGIAERLDDRLRLLTGGRRTALPRHRTLTATLDWSYDSLSEAEQWLLRRLSIFTGEFSFAEAEGISADPSPHRGDISEHIEGLLAKSLLTPVRYGPALRYRLLDTTRAYALSKLARSQEADEVAEQLCRYLCAMLADSLGELENTPKNAWLAQYGRHLNNIQVALDWAISSSGNSDICIALTAAAIPLWFQLSLVSECRSRVQDALSCVPPGEDWATQARHVMKLYMALGLSRVFTTGLAPQAAVAWQKALKVAQDLSDIESQLEALWGLWFCQIGAGEYRAALDTAYRFGKLATSDADRLLAQRLIGAPLFCMGDNTGARSHIEKSLAHSAAPTAPSSLRFRFDQIVASRALLAQVLWLQGYPDQAMLAAKSSVAQALDSNHAISLCDALSQGACPIALWVGDHALADASIGMLLDLTDQHALGPWNVLGRCWQGALAVRRGDFDRGLLVLSSAFDELQEGRLFANFSPGFVALIAQATAHVETISAALAIVDRALQRAEEKDERWCLAELTRAKSEILQQGEHDHGIAERLLLEAFDWARRQGALAWELRVATSMVQLHRGRASCEQARSTLAGVYAKFDEGFETQDLSIARSLLGS
jgi:predicted ATPase/DNA-binding winged helix-turn-helix (wHTH) protein